MLISDREIIITETLQSDTLPNQRFVPAPRNVTLPHQALYGVVPQLSEVSTERFVANDLRRSGEIDTLKLNWTKWKPFLQGVNLHNLSDDYLSKVFSANVGSIEQAVALRQCHDNALSRVSEILDAYSASVVTKLAEQGQAADERIHNFIESNFALDIQSTFYDSHSLSGYNNSAALTFSHQTGVTVMDIDLSECPTPIKYLTIIFIKALTFIGDYSCSSDLVYQMSYEQDLVEYCMALTQSERDRLNEAVYGDEEKAYEFLKNNYSEMVTEYEEVYGDIEALIYNLRDVMDINFLVGAKNCFDDLLIAGDLKSTLCNIKNQLQCWANELNPIIVHPLCKKLNVCCHVLLQECKFHLLNYLNCNSDAAVADLRIISFDFDNDKSCLDNVSQYFNDMCEDAALDVDLTDEQVIGALKQYKLADAILGVLAS